MTLGCCNKCHVFYAEENGHDCMSLKNTFSKWLGMADKEDAIEAEKNVKEQAQQNVNALLDAVVMALHQDSEPKVVGYDSLSHKPNEWEVKVTGTSNNAVDLEFEKEFQKAEQVPVKLPYLNDQPKTDLNLQTAKACLPNPEKVLAQFEKIPMKPPYNPECDKCRKNQEHCGHCPNPKCLNCKNFGEFCGYCNWVSYKDNEAYCKELIKHWGIDDQYEVVVADNYHLQIDCDEVSDVQFCLKQLKILSHTVKVKNYKITKSKSGNRHVIIELEDPYEIWQRVAMQACLGSDRVREVLNILNILNKNANPVLLIEKKEVQNEIEI